MNNYEKKYKEALEKAKESLKDGTITNIAISYIESIFPELKEEIEDDRIRNWLEEHIEAMPYNSIEFKDVKRIDVLYWLEKQGEKKFADGTFVNVDDVREDFVNDVYRVLDADPTNDRANQIIDAFDNLPTVTIKQDPCEHCEEVMLNCHNFPCIKKRAFEQGKTALEAINEEKVDNANKVEPKDYSSIDPHFFKPTDKVEPKFKVKYAGNEYNVFETKDIAGVTYYGIEDEPNHIDYVLSNNCEIVSVQKIANEFASKFHEGDFVVIQETTYLISKIEGLNVTLSLNGREGIFDIDVLRNAHLYTIEDAKAGDVIYSRHNTESFEWIGIFKSLDKENKGVHFYGFWNNVTKTFKVCGNELFVSYDDFSPATKEQCDTLEKAIANAGYTFDFEKKELKKIEDEIEIPFGAKDSELIEESYNIPKGFHAEIDKDKVVIKKGEKPTAWSEEDENIKEWIMSDINKLLALNRKSFVIADKEITWLKSLKGRVGCEVNCTTTKKWSEEDIATISRVISIVKWAAYSDHSHPILNDEGATELVERLKSLKERYTWKPSDEQMDALQYVCRNLNPPLSDKLGWDSLKTLELFYKILKKLY